MPVFRKNSDVILISNLSFSTGFPTKAKESTSSTHPTILSMSGREKRWICAFPKDIYVK